MWVKKEDSIMQEESHKKNTLKDRLIESLQFGMVISLVSFVIGAISSPDRIYNVINNSINIGLLTSLANILLSNSKKRKSNSLLCDSCYHSKNFDKELNCKCGGQFFPINNYYWVEENKNLTFTDCTWVYKYKVLKDDI
ncbi:hypothetical protein JCM15579A_34550 [Marinifilum fragile]